MMTKQIVRRRLTGCLVLMALLMFSVPAVATAASGDDDATCLGCHEGYDRSLAPSSHRLSSGTVARPSTKISCVSCHSGAAAHVGNPSADNISNPARLVGNKATEVCTPCHVAHRELDDYGFDAHSSAQFNCAECHKVHSYKKALILDDKAEFCWKCHEDTRTDFMKRSNHPVLQGNLTCLSCHRFTERLDDNRAYEFGRVCQDCHPDQSGPFPHEHAAVNAYAVNGNGCVECHDPHGSTNDKLLKQAVGQLCKQCHVVPGHTTAHEGAYARYDCLVCHSDIHGSYDNQSLLDPNLSAKLGSSCYCHNRNQ